uniref:alpha-2B adrenergic receptor-like isoform X2 n=1 Tax=Styela clava TaxID=7725 RepID=UPI00193A434C|nr:alpha-2B adrenergic receptor-like isoform X2 [Styela clava]
MEFNAGYNSTMMMSSTSSENITLIAWKDLEKEAWERGIFSLSEAIAFSVAVGLMFIFSTIANIVTITVIAKTPKLISSPFNIMIISLCVSDLISTIYSPFILFWKTFGLFEYPLPVFFCKSTFAVDYWTNSVTIQHILCFLAIRLIAMKYPHRLKRFTIQRAKMLVCFIWLETALGNLIFAMWLPHVYPSSDLSPTGKSCAVHHARWKYARLFFYIGHPIFLFIPTILIVILTFFLIGVLTKRMESIRERYKIFLLIYNVLRKRVDARSSWLFSMLAHILLRISECLNPVFYNLGSSQMREATFKFLRIGENGPAGEPIPLDGVKEKSEQTHKTAASSV